MNLALNQAIKAKNKNDVPIGCVIVKNNKIIAKSYNQKEQKKNAIKHAEITAINKACKKLKTWHLEECVLYSTTEPCLMCMGAIAQARIKRVVYATDNKKFGYSNFINIDNKIMNTKIEITKNICKDESEKLLKSFFENIRK